MSTPEGKVKAQVRKIIAKFGDDIYSYWPVPSGFGASSLDCIGCIRGRMFLVETKAPGKKPTPRQRDCIDRSRRAGAEVFVIDGSPEQLVEFEAWLIGVSYPGR